METKMDNMLNDIRCQIWHLEMLVKSQEATICMLSSKLKRIEKIMNNFNTKPIEQDTIAYMVKKEILEIIREF